MAFIRTIVCIIFLALSMSCVTQMPSFLERETQRYNTYLELHSIHWEEGTFCMSCPYPYRHNSNYDSFNPYWNY